jgi:hypothetical protein
MNFEDTALLRLANEGTRRGIFDELVLEQTLDAAFVLSAGSVQGPFDATYDEFRVGMFIPTRASVEGGWSALGGTDRIEARADVTWPGRTNWPRIDAVWRGKIIARVSLAVSRIDRVSSARPGLASLDDDIAPLPADPVALERARRQALRARLRAGAAQPEAVDDAFIDQLLAHAGVTTVGEFAVRHRAEQATERLRIGFSEPDAPGEPSTAPRPFPVTVALLIRAGSHALTDILAESKAAKWLLAPIAERATDSQVRPRTPIVVGVVLPGTVFDDPAWPGAASGATGSAARRARRIAAAEWLGQEGIVLLPFDPPA